MRKFFKIQQSSSLWSSLLLRPTCRSIVGGGMFSQTKINRVSPPGDSTKNNNNTTASSSSSSPDSLGGGRHKSVKEILNEKPEYVYNPPIVSSYGISDPALYPPEDDFVFEGSEDGEVKECGEMECVSSQRKSTERGRVLVTSEATTNKKEAADFSKKKINSEMEAYASLVLGGSSSFSPIYEQDAIVLHEPLLPFGTEKSRLQQLVSIKREPGEGNPPETRQSSRSAKYSPTISQKEIEIFQLEKKMEEEFGYMPLEDDLPYEAPNIAQQALEMEVSGLIDETWQDDKKARVEDVAEIGEVLKHMKAKNVVAIDVSNKCSSFDYIMCVSCENQRHIHLASWAVQEADKVDRVTKIKRQKTSNHWEVVPVGRIVVNIMTEEFRRQMNIERKWIVTSEMDPVKLAAASPVSEGRTAKAHGLWTLTLNLQDLEDYEIDYCKEALITQV